MLPRRRSRDQHRPADIPKAGQTCFGLVAVVALVLVTACDDGMTAPAAESDGLKASFAATAAPVSQEYSWSQGLPPTAMGSTYQRACFIVFIGGKFETEGDSVRIYKSGTTWYLGGTAAYQADGVRVKARCYPNVTVGAYEYDVSPNGLVGMEAPPYVCGLTGINGHFGRVGDYVAISLRHSSSTRWWLNAVAYSLNPGERHVSARARCISPFTYYSQTAYVWNGLQPPLPPPTQMWSTIGESFCYLTLIEGSLNGGKFLWVYPSGNQWWLAGNQYQAGARGGAHCLKRYGWGT